MSEKSKDTLNQVEQMHEETKTATTEQSEVKYKLIHDS